jgi:Capsule assembly protein Wzi
LPADAGPALDEALARHRALLVPGPTPIELDRGAGDDVTSAIGGPGGDVPSFIRPALRGEGGVQLRTGTALLGAGVEARLGVAWRVADPYPLSFDESSISAPLGDGRIYASVERRHWGPLWTGSLILDGGARAVPALGWRKEGTSAFSSPLLAWLGPWQLDAFAGQLTQRSGPSHPHFLGARFQVMPLVGLELAASGTLQWGGSGRPESAGSLLRAVAGQSNVDPSHQSDDPGNGLAGFDAHYTFALGGPRTLSIYGQMIGEDEAGHLPSHYLGAIGVDSTFALGAGTARVFIERADTAMSGSFGTPILGGAYRTRIYPDGYTQQGAPLAYPPGGDVVLDSIGILGAAGAGTGMLMLHRGYAYATAQLYPGGGRLAGLDGEVAWQIDARSRVGLALACWRDPSGERTRAQLWWRIALP